MAEKPIESMYRDLREIIGKLGSVVVSFSGGADSTLLLKVALDVLGCDRVLAATAQSPSFPACELEAARESCGRLGARHRVLETNELDDERFAVNPPERCYYCKRELLSSLRAIADEEGLQTVAEGSNLDDARDPFRPGLRATQELGARSPLREAGLTKAHVRELSARLGLPTHDEPSRACLASRVPYGERITRDKLRRIEKAEDLLHEIGFRQLRVRCHGNTARIELDKDEDLSRLLEGATRERVVAELKELGFVYVTLDLEGYRTGSMNEILASAARRGGADGGPAGGTQRCTATK